jgi:tRNA nucleotidyltransferase (CCA-adding enzyme)
MIKIDLKDDLFDKAYPILYELDHFNEEAYIVGGYVRDKLLGFAPKDIDIVTSAKPDKVKKIFSNAKEIAFKGKGEAYGITIVDGIEVATFRTEYYENSNPVVSVANTLEEDVRRRDFTINALACDIDGNVIDYVNGLREIESKIVKFVGTPEERLNEDPSRALRFFRFMSKINGLADIDSEKAIKKFFNRDGFDLIPKEKVKDEILAALSSQSPTLFFSRLSFILKSLHKTREFNEETVYHEEKLFDHLLLTMERLSSKNPLLRLAGLLHDVGKVYTKSYNEKRETNTFYKHEIVSSELARVDLHNLRFSNYEIDYVTKVIKLHMNRIPENTRSMRKLLGKLDEEPKVTLEDFLDLRCADFSGRISKIRPAYVDPSEISNAFYYAYLVRSKKEPTNKSMLAVNGDDVMRVLNIQPGPKVGKILDELLEWVMDTPEKNTKEYLEKYLEEVYSDS